MRFPKWYWHEDEPLDELCLRLLRENQRGATLEELATAGMNKDTVAKYVLIAQALALGGRQPNSDGRYRTALLLRSAINQAIKNNAKRTDVRHAITSSTTTQDAYEKVERLATSNISHRADSIIDLRAKLNVACTLAEEVAANMVGCDIDSDTRVDIKRLAAAAKVLDNL